jgi:arylsulfatase A-like enzyme
MIVVDAGRYDRLGSNQTAAAVTPNLQQLAEQATSYTNANAPAGATRFSMNSIFVGLYPEAYGFSQDKLPSPEQLTLTQRLQAAGYETFMFSSDPCVSPETRMDRGFDKVCYLAPWSPLPLRRSRLLVRHWRSIAKALLWRSRSYKVPVEMLATEALRRLRQREPTDSPFFMYVHLDVHRPYISDRRYLRRFLEPGITNRQIREVEQLQKVPCFYGCSEDMASPRKELLHSIVRSMYDASWFKTDLQIRQFTDILRQQDLFESTMIIITSDHGEYLGERDMFGHGPFPYQEAMQVPLLVKYPKEAGKLPGPDDRVTSTIDLMPTICAMGGCAVDNGEINGISLLDTARRHEFVINQRWSYRRGGVEPLVTQYPHYDWAAHDLGHIIALRDERYKYVWTAKGPSYLFDLKCDPREKQNLVDSDDGETAALTTEYARKLEDWRTGLTMWEGCDERMLRPTRRGPYTAPATA